MRLGNPRQVLRASSAKGHVLAWMGDTDRARAWLERQLQEWGDRDERARTDLLWHLALVELWAGRWAVAERYADAVLELIADYGLEVPYDRFPAALAALLQGRFEVARGYSLRALSLGEGQELEFYFGVLATCDLWSGEPRAALPSFLRAEQAADALGNGEPGMRPWRADYVEALLQVGRIEDAEGLVDDWERAATPLGRDRVLADVARCRGLIAAARGDVTAAIGLLDAAATRHEVVGDPFGHARALLALGGARRRARQKRAARIAIEAALAEFKALGAPSWVAAARDELGRIGGRQRLEGLSPSELAVANLVAEGRTNHEIAAALFLGERTVAGHLTRIYAKLGIRSRTELAQLTSEGSPMSRTGVGNIETS
ncbi:MAG: hypothetical protein HYX55_03360 [Chloroflexi bacterium]|nr:hypothetical protein [Chloroflexota bacterium]